VVSGKSAAQIIAFKVIVLKGRDFSPAEGVEQSPGLYRLRKNPVLLKGTASAVP
jgi:hypothetical protein